MGYTTSKIVRIIINIFTTFTSFFPHFLNPTISLLHLMRVITNAHTSTHTTSLMHKRYHLPLLFVTLIVWDTGMKKLKERTTNQI